MSDIYDVTRKDGTRFSVTVPKGYTPTRADLDEAYNHLAGQRAVANFSQGLGVTPAAARSQGVAPAVAAANARPYSPGLVTGGMMSGITPDPNATGNVLTAAAADIYGKAATEQGLAEAPGFTGGIARLGTGLTSPENVSLAIGTAGLGGLPGLLTSRAAAAVNAARSAGSMEEVSQLLAAATRYQNAARATAAGARLAGAGAGAYFGGSALAGGYEHGALPGMPFVDPATEAANEARMHNDPAGYGTDIAGSLLLGGLGGYGAVHGFGTFEPPTLIDPTVRPIAPEGTPGLPSPAPFTPPTTAPEAPPVVSPDFVPPPAGWGYDVNGNPRTEGVPDANSERPTDTAVARQDESGAVGQAAPGTTPSAPLVPTTPEVPAEGTGAAAPTVAPFAPTHMLRTGTTVIPVQVTADNGVQARVSVKTEAGNEIFAARNKLVPLPQETPPNEQQIAGNAGSSPAPVASQPGAQGADRGAQSVGEQLGTPQPLEPGVPGAQVPEVAAQAPTPDVTAGPPHVQQAYGDVAATPAGEGLTHEETLAAAHKVLETEHAQGISHPSNEDRPITTTAEAAAEKYNRNGFTRTQQTHLVSELDNAVASFTADPKAAPIAIAVPADGKFTVSDVKQAEFLRGKVAQKNPNPNPAPRYKPAATKNDPLSASPWAVLEKTNAITATPEGQPGGAAGVAGTAAAAEPNAQLEQQRPGSALAHPAGNEGALHAGSGSAPAPQEHLAAATDAIHRLEYLMADAKAHRSEAGIAAYRAAYRDLVKALKPLDITIGHLKIGTSLIRQSAATVTQQAHDRLTEKYGDYSGEGEPASTEPGLEPHDIEAGAKLFDALKPGDRIKEPGGPEHVVAVKRPGSVDLQRSVRGERDTKPFRVKRAEFAKDYDFTRVPTDIREFNSGVTLKNVTDGLKTLGVIPNGPGTGRFREVGNVSVNLMNRVYAANSAKETGMTLARTFANHITADLTDPADIDLFERLILHENAQRVPGGNVPELSGNEQADYSDWMNSVMPAGATFDRWSKVADAVARYQATAKPDVLAKTMKTAPGMTVATTPNDLYMRLFPQKNAKGEEIPANQMGRPKGATGPAANRSKVKRASNVQRAYGTGQDYRQDFAKNLEQTYADVTFKAALADLMTHAHAEGWAVPETFTGVTSKFNGKDRTFTLPNSDVVPAVLHVEKNLRYPIQDASGAILDYGGKDYAVWLPSPLEQAIREVTAPSIKKSGPADAFDRIQRLRVSVALANPGTFLWHTYRILSVGSSAAGPAMKGPLKWLPMGPKVQMLYQIWNTDMADPENFGILQDVMKAGAGSLRPFSDMVGPKLLRGLAGNTHEKLFGFPEGKGLFDGFDLRVRVAMEKLRRAFEGNTDPQRIRDFGNQLGQLGKNPAYHIEFMKVIMPYAGTQFPMKVAEFRQMAGEGGLKANTPAGRAYTRLHVFYSAVLATLIAKEILNYWGSGHFSDKNAPGHQHQIGMRDGRYMSMNVLNPGFERPMRDSGAEAVLMNKGSEKDWGTAVVNGLMNSFLPPEASDITTLATGNAAHLISDHEHNQALMRVAPTKDSHGRPFTGPQQLRANAIAAALNSNTMVQGAGAEAGFGSYPAAKEPPAWKVASLLQILTGKIISHPQAGSSSRSGRSGREGRRGR